MRNLCAQEPGTVLEHSYAAYKHDPVVMKHFRNENYYHTPLAPNHADRILNEHIQHYDCLHVLITFMQTEINR